ncbi:MAG: RsmB/NOP family class I SAM-dependent RNA methyltransferase [Candidatus Woesearchaeota archaeon]|jgi:NOL1/NOP2/sun family putative RNA methylase|nr:RsmB/NOP family class I SAM-dependent RNA methyltransferase [Candidatus Woesearchaeota archaeon]MDP7506430.1 RsmB/NOP family class I SAM-dependent RNA methyltransferase [Candidatus Woesearchaeota archaeon]|tara:strand:- start:1678 stop:2607 length:930 start_codon:yes stop_codon:yes gene_type:complete
MEADKIEIKPKFKERYSSLTDWESFKKYSLMYLRRSIRVNTLKMSVEELKKRLEEEWELVPIPWCKEGFWIKNIKTGRRDIGNLPEHSLGYFYIQEAVSMIPPIVLGAKPGEIVLDMCASPGSKASQIAAMMKNKGVFVANDYKTLRMKPLSLNLQRCGITNNIITLMEGRWFKDIKFDRILVDAPCSGTGTIRKSLKTLRMWNPNMIRRLAGTQKQLICQAFSCLKKGGTMVYSTCSLEPEEDEAVIDYFLSKCGDAKLEEIEIDIKRGEPVMEFDGNTYNPEVKKCLRIWPQDNDTEGFFVVKIKKV